MNTTRQYEKRRVQIIYYLTRILSSEPIHAVLVAFTKTTSIRKPAVPLRLITWITIFAIAMGMLESAVVVYLRELYYPDGFIFPLKSLDISIAYTEIAREAATIIMLAAIGIIAGRNPSERFAWFLYTFAVWDIFYYVFLKVFLNWPESLMTWDVLFLIPVTWTGPVITPLIITFAMIHLAVIILEFSYKNGNATIGRKGLSFLIGGSLVVILAFIYDYSSYILKNNSLSEYFTIITSEENIRLSQTYIPESFNWYIFTIGVVIIYIGIYSVYQINKFCKS